MNMNHKEEFYPTPEALLEKIFEGVKWPRIKTVLEPSCGKGDMALWIKETAKTHYMDLEDIDCIELDPELRQIAKGNGLRVVHDDFLTYRTFKRYDLIAMNPPFSKGAEHLMKALEMQKDGGNIVCILNAETLKNPFTNLRKVLKGKLEQYNATIEYMEEAFLDSEHPTTVEVAVVKVSIPAKSHDSSILESLKSKTYDEGDFCSRNLAVKDLVRSIVKNYEVEVEAGIRLIQEYLAMQPYLMDSLDMDDAYKKPIIRMKIGEKDEISVNSFVRSVRKKYWSRLFNDRRFTANMTSNLRDEYRSMVHELADYDFSFYNIKTIQEEMSRNLSAGIEECIIKLFDELSYQYAYSDELSKNIHYYNGWKTNKAWIINKKVILPWMNAWNGYTGRFSPTDYRLLEKFEDIEHALNYLSGKTSSSDLRYILNRAEKEGQTRKVQLKYFTVTFYKKGTCHLEFTDLELLKKLNIFGSQRKGWLPPAYGKKSYKDLTPEEKTVIDDFEGRASYEDTYANADKYLIDTFLPALDMAS